MNMRQARTVARRLYGSKAQVEAHHRDKKFKRVFLENHPQAGVHMVLGWGYTWEEAITHSRKRIVQLAKLKERNRRRRKNAKT